MCMTSVFPWLGGTACALLLGLSPALGQTTQRPGSPPEVRRLSLIIGGGVQIANGVAVGKIEDVVLNDRGCIDYVIVVYQDKYVPIPWTVARVDYGQRIVIVDITEQRFAQVPTFTRTEFSVLSTSEFNQRVHGAFGTKADPASAKSGAPAETPKTTKSEAKPEPAKATKSEAKPEPAKVDAQDKPKAESQEKPKAQPRDKPKVESKDKPKN